MFNVATFVASNKMKFTLILLRCLSLVITNLLKIPSIKILRLLFKIVSLYIHICFCLKAVKVC